MLTVRQKALNTVRYLRLTPREVADLRHEKTLNVELQGTQLYWPAHYVAQYCLRLALEQGCTKVRVHQGMRQAEFDVMKLVKVTRAMTLNGHLPTSSFRFVPPRLVTKQRFTHFGEVVEPKRGYVSVPSSLVSGHVASAS